jgi:hypothetical protein
VSTTCPRFLVRPSGFEPPRYCYRQPLKLVRLPVPPRPHVGDKHSLTVSEKGCKPSHATLAGQFPISDNQANGLLQSRGWRFAPSVVIGNKRVTCLFPGECAVIRAKSQEFARLCSYPGVRTPCLSISTAFPNLFNRVSSFLASVIQRQYSLRWV